MDRQARSRTRRDGWTAQRQLRFLDTLARTRSVTRAAAAAGLSRKSAYRLRDRSDGALFAALWDRLVSAPGDTAKVTPKGGTRESAAREKPVNLPKDTKYRKWRTRRFNPLPTLIRDLHEQGLRAVSSMTLDGSAEPPKFTA
jgi:hypothetical protein